jgi:class 3 adenylate cyclase
MAGMSKGGDAVIDPAPTSVGAGCPFCGAAAAGGARFCSTCGGRLSGAGVERRVVTMLFADLVGSTRLVEALDPEAARRLLDDVFGRVAAEVHRRGGTLEKYIGDAIFAVFGFPRAHGDDAARAVQTALALRAAIGTATSAIGDVQVRLRIGLHTGEVVVVTPAGDLRLTGDAVHTAARIQQCAEPGEILVSTRTLRASREPVATGPARQLAIRGRQQAVEVAEVLGPGLAEPLPARLYDRKDDLFALVDALVSAEEHGGFTLLVGEAGVGKSTLARAAAAELADQVRVLWGRCLPDWQCLPLWPLHEVLAAAAGVRATAPPKVLASAMTRLVDGSGPRPGSAAPTAAAVHRLLGLEAAAGGPAGEGDARELAEALHRVLCGLASRERVLVVLEDLHWATPDLLELVTFLVASECRDPRRLAFLGVSRPELPAGDPRFVAGTRARRIELGALPEGPTSALAASVLGADAPAELLDRVSEASQGNPLFVRELALAIRDTGALADGDASLPIPDSLQGLIASRLDRLAPPSRQVLGQASVVGRTFSAAAVAGMAAGDAAKVERELHALEATGLIERVAGELAGAGQYTFHHALFRDVAYSGLAKERRSDLHRQLADWYAAGDGHGFPADELVAHHLLAAVRLAREVRLPTPADRHLAVRAVVACRRAAERLRDQEALAATARVLDGAMAMAALAGSPLEDVTELLALRGAVRAATGDHAGALDDLRAASDSKRAAIRAQAFTELSHLQAQLGEHRSAAVAADRAMAEARIARTPSLAALALRAKAHAPYLDGRLAETEALLEEAVAEARRGDRPRLVGELEATLLMVRLHLAVPLATVGAEARRLAGTAGATGRSQAEASAHCVLGEVALLRGDPAGAERHYGSALRQRREVGLAFRRLLWPLVGLTLAAIEAGDAELARGRAGEALAATTQPGRPAEPEAEASLALACLAGRDPAGAAAALGRARAGLGGGVLGHAELLRAEGRLAIALGRPGEAVERFERSLACLDGSDYRLDRLRGTVDLVAGLRAAGRLDVAAPLARAALRGVRAIGAHALARPLRAATAERS